MAVSFCWVLAFAACTGERKSTSAAESQPAGEADLNVFSAASLTLRPELGEESNLTRLYQPRQGRPFWLGDGVVSADAREAAAELSRQAPARAPERQGDLKALASRLESCRVPGCGDEELLDLELSLSEAVLSLGERQAHGRPRREGLVSWHLPPRDLDVAAYLAERLGTRPFAEVFRELAPVSSELVALEAALERYQQLAAAGGWSKLPTEALEKTLHEGESFDVAWLALLAERLRQEGYEAEAPVEGVYLGALVEAVRNFQRDHGLEPDGNLGKASLEALNMPASLRVRQLEVNLERLRWVKEPGPGRRVEVHLPAFMAEVWDDQSLVYSTRVIVGKRDWPTPLFEDEISALILNPPWHVPDSIASDEILAKILADPDYLAKENMLLLKRGGGEEVDPATVDWASLSPKALPFRFRQRPGEGNLLGKIKFSLPNHHNIYLHDTPGRSLFVRSDRALSHGCVRVDKPFALADVLVADMPEWPPRALEKAAAAGKSQGIQLPSSIPVRFLYTTARSRPEGGVVLFRDVYGLDSSQ